MSGPGLALMRRRVLLLAIAMGVPGLLRASADGRDSLRGRLALDAAGGPVLKLPGGGQARLEGDRQSTAVVNDARLLGMEFELFGKQLGPDRFRIDPIHARAMFVFRDSKRLIVTYWCDVCSIRTYSPGKCACCQKETDLDLRDPDEK